jgi:hypothetical protein
MLKLEPNRAIALIDMEDPQLTNWITDAIPPTVDIPLILNELLNVTLSNIEIESLM